MIDGDPGNVKLWLFSLGKRHMIIDVTAIRVVAFKPPERGRFIIIFIQRPEAPLSEIAFQSLREPTIAPPFARTKVVACKLTPSRPEAGQRRCAGGVGNAIRRADPDLL